MPGNTKGGSITVPLTSCLTGLDCFVNKNKNCQLSYSWFQSSQTGGQWYTDTSHFSIPCKYPCFSLPTIHYLSQTEHYSAHITNTCLHSPTIWDMYNKKDRFVMYGNWTGHVVSKCFSLLSVTFTGLDKHASFLWNMHITYPGYKFTTFYLLLNLPTQ